MEWASKKYNAAYNDYMPWIEDKVLGYWGENKTSYTAKGTLLSISPIHPLPATSSAFSPSPQSLPTNTTPTNTDKLSTDVTGDKNINAVQGGVAEGVGGTLSSGGVLGGVGDATSKEGVNRAERGDLDPSKAGDVAKQKEEPKTWTQTLSGGYIGGK